VREIAAIAVQASGLGHVDCEYSGGERGWKGDVPVVRLDSAKIKLLGWSSRRSSYQALEAAAQALVQALGNVPCKL